MYKHEYNSHTGVTPDPSSCKRAGLPDNPCVYHIFYSPNSSVLDILRSSKSTIGEGLESQIWDAAGTASSADGSKSSSSTEKSEPAYF